VLGIEMRTGWSILANQHGDFGTWLSTNAQPVIDSIVIQDHAGIGFRHEWIIRADFFNNATIAWSSGIRGTNAEERSILSAHFLHADFY
jgi:hypothetical protein